MTKKISWRVGDVIQYEDKKPRTEIAKIVGHVDGDRVPNTWSDWSPSIYAKRIRDGETVELTEREITGRGDVIAATAAMAHTPLSMRYRHRLLGEHVHADVFTGSPGGTLGKSGTLVFRQDEWAAFVLAQTSLGSVLPNFDVSFSDADLGE